MKPRLRIFILSVFLVCSTLLRWNAQAEVKVIETDSTYIIGDNDSKVDARRIATQEAKRKALELAGTFVASLTDVKNYQLSIDEVKMYTAGVLETEIVSEQMRGTTEHPEIYIKARCKIDTNVLMAQIDRYRENEDLKDQLGAFAKENDDLKKERDALVKQLAAEKDKKQAEDTRSKLDAVLSKEESNDDTHKVWVNIGPQLIELDENNPDIGQNDLDRSAAMLQKAIAANPQNQRARFLLASIYQRQGNNAAAESEIRTALQYHPANPSLHLRLGVLLRAQGKYDMALDEFHFVERVRPHNPLMLFNTGMTYKDMGHCGKSAPYLKRFLREPQSRKFPKRREKAVQVLRECGERPGHIRRLGQR